MLQAYREIVYEKIPEKMSRLFRGSANCQKIQYVERICAPRVNLIMKFEFLPRGIVFARFLCFFVSLLVSLSATLRENGWTDLHDFQGRCGVTMGRPDYILGQFG